MKFVDSNGYIPIEMSKEQAKVFDEIVNYAKEKGVNVVTRIAE